MGGRGGRSKLVRIQPKPSRAAEEVVEPVPVAIEKFENTEEGQGQEGPDGGAGGGMQYKLEDTEGMDISTTVTIVEEDGTTSIDDDASVSSIIPEGVANSTIQFAQSPGVAYRVVGLGGQDRTMGLQPMQTAPGNVQLITPAMNGQFFAINSPNPLGSENTRKTAIRDEKKKATHNELEKKRRDKITNGINKLAKLVPACNEPNPNQSAKPGSLSHPNTSKEGILAKACEYINELKTTNICLANTLHDHDEATAHELDSLKRQVADLKRENQMLRQQLGPTEEAATVIKICLKG